MKYVKKKKFEAVARQVNFFSDENILIKKFNVHCERFSEENIPIKLIHPLWQVGGFLRFLQP